MMYSGRTHHYLQQGLQSSFWASSQEGHQASVEWYDGRGRHLGCKRFRFYTALLIHGSSSGSSKCQKHFKMTLTANSLFLSGKSNTLSSLHAPLSISYRKEEPPFGVQFFVGDEDDEGDEVEVEELEGWTVTMKELGMNKGCRMWNMRLLVDGAYNLCKLCHF